jgi:hypothetical protein
LLLLLSRSQVLLQNVLIVGIAPEDTLIIHNVESLAALLFFRNGRVEHAVLGATILVLVSHYLGLGSFE